MKVISADVSANYDDVNKKLPRKESVEMGYFVDEEKLKGYVFVNAHLTDREDDYVTVSIELDELMLSLSKVIKEERME